MHPSDSTIQTTEAQNSILKLAKEQLNLKFDLIETPIVLDEGVSWRVDGASKEDQILVEVYSRIGALHGAQKKKVGLDILKLSTIKKFHPDWANAKLFIAFASEEAKTSITGWLSFAALKHEVSLIVCPVESKLTQSLLAAQARQNMQNVPIDVQLEVHENDDN